MQRQIPNFTTLLDSASVLITALQGTLKKLKRTGFSSEDGLLQQFLDDENLYIKQIPHVTFIWFIMI